MRSEVLTKAIELRPLNFFVFSTHTLYFRKKYYISNLKFELRLLDVELRTFCYEQ